jgi:predicted kinase
VEREKKCARLVLVTGHPASGKTTFARSLARRLGTPLFSKDGLKEAFFDGAGVGDRAWSQCVGRGAIALLSHCAEALLAAECDIVLECNFDPRFGRVEMLCHARKHGARIIELNLRANPNVLLQRFLARAKSGERHQGHDDNPAMAEDLKVRLEKDFFACLFPEAIKARNAIIDGVSVSGLCFDTSVSIGEVLADAEVVAEELFQAIGE